MSNRDDSPKYSYTPGEYQPAVGNQIQPDNSTVNFDLGYHNEAGLRDYLGKIVEIADAIITSAETDLGKYSLKVTEGSNLEKAHTQAWPNSIGNPASYVSYQEYKGLEKSTTRSAEYVRRAYEGNVRGAFGTNSIDAILTSKAVKSEATNIKKFIDTYLGEVNDSSEYRTLELLQDWAETGLQQITNVATVYQERVENEVQIPTAEMDQITESDARNYQAFFQTKINAVNKEIKQLVDDLDKEHNAMSEIYYQKFLGPALKFRLNVARPLETNVGLETFLSKQAVHADQAMSSNYINLLTDQIKRNETFGNRMDNLITRIRVRDNYAGFVKQLNSKLEDQLSSPFIDVDIPEAEIDGFKDLASVLEAEALNNDPFVSGHALLDGTDADNAHSQYILKKGDVLEGDINVADGVKIGGIELAKHSHTGADGSSKIQGTSIEGLVTSSIDKTEEVHKPLRLRLINNQTYTGTSGVVLVNSRIAWDSNPELTFEVQTTIVGNNPQEEVNAPKYSVTTLATIATPLVSAIASDVNFFTYASQTALYTRNWLTGTTTVIAGTESSWGDIEGLGSASKFANISDIAQDYFDGRIYIADSDNRKIKMTGKANTAGIVGPTTISTAWTSEHPVRRIDTQGQNFLNTLYAIVGPNDAGKDEIYKLVDTDGNNFVAGTYAATEIAEISDKYSGLDDIAVTPNGYIYLLQSQSTALIQFDPTSKTIQNFNIQDDTSGATPTGISSDNNSDIYITYSLPTQASFVKKFNFLAKTTSVFTGSLVTVGSTDGTAKNALYTNLRDIAILWDGVQRTVPVSGNRFYLLDDNKVRLIHLEGDSIVPL